MSSSLAFSGVEWGGGWGFCLQAVSREISQVLEKEEERRGKIGMAERHRADLMGSSQISSTQDEKR